jgi:hypothetical protein
LPPSFVHHHGNAVGQIQAAVVRAHGQAQAVLRGDGVQHVGGQAAGFGAEQEGVTGSEVHLVVALLAACA